MHLMISVMFRAVLNHDLPVTESPHL